MKSTRNHRFSTCSKKRVDKAGTNFRNRRDNEEDTEVLENWRASHRQVLNTFQTLLRNRARHSEGEIMVVQRHKRKDTIIDKLRRHPKMKLSQMNDIAGCRVIFENAEVLYEFRENLHNSKLSHDLKNDPDKYDYIKSPKNDGYRGVHDVYSYNSNSRYTGLLVEIQYRTLVQHSWATAVEVMGFVTDNNLKFGQGDKRWLEIFRFASEILARVFEGRKSCLGNLGDNEIVEGFDRLNSEIGFVEKLRLLDVIREDVSEAKNIILMFDDEERRLSKWDFPSAPKALRKLAELERENPGKNIVFVRGDKGEDIREAFKNYFSDTEDFIYRILEGYSLLSDKPTESDSGVWVKWPLMDVDSEINEHQFRFKMNI
ncbi:MAG: RelA/SpoT domain-containing protein [Candidatus Dadabacteria bacterium]|nr:RelA/SpoT domain-containing protein [Candidatus Dadabacteria bacterium]